MRRSAFWAAAGAALIVIVATEAAAARDIGGDTEGDGPLRGLMHNPSSIDPRAGHDVQRQVSPIRNGWG